MLSKECHKTTLPCTMYFLAVADPPPPVAMIYLKHALSNLEHATQCQGRIESAICTLLWICKVIATDKACLEQRSRKHWRSQRQVDASLKHCFAEQWWMPLLQLESFPDRVTENIVCIWICFKTSPLRLTYLGAHLYNCNRVTGILINRGGVGTK